MQNLKIASLFLSLIAIGLFIGCDSKKTVTAPATIPSLDSDSESEVATAESNVSDDEAAKFAEDWLEALRTRSIANAGRLVAWKEILGRSIDSLDVAEKHRNGLMQGAMEAIPTLSGEISDAMVKGSYKLVHIKRRGGYPFALFRLVDPTGGFNYHLFRVVNVRGRVRADQFFIAMTGEEMSDTFRNVIGAGAQSLTIAGRLSGAQQQFLDDIKAQKEMHTAISAGKLDAALGVYKRMPERLRKSKMPMLYRIMATELDDGDNYARAVDEYLETFPGDAAAGILTLDAGVSHKDTEMILKGHASLKEWTGGDPFLDLMVAANLAVLNDLEKAKELIQPVDAKSIEMPDAHDYLLTIALTEGNYEEVLQQLQILRDDYGYEFVDLSEVEEYKGFVASPQFKKWQTR